VARPEGSGPSWVTSVDGTRIGYWTSGQGPPLVMVHGVTSDHSRWQPIRPLLEPYVTVVGMDRRGRGASGDRQQYSLEREWQDVATVVEAAAQVTGQPVDLYGHSYGGLCAYGAAASTSAVRRLVLYEGWPARDPQLHLLPTDVSSRMARSLAEGDRDAVVETLFRFFGTTDDELRGLRTQPAWQARVAAAHTIGRELQATAGARFDPEQAAAITAPTLLLVGADSQDPARDDAPTVAAALPDARTVVMDSQGHLADVLAPEVVAGHMLAFLRG
jgi:pimeloyl-ACP methyl ester carboxylesterase